MDSAPIAFQTAIKRCPPMDAPGSCRAYHAVWQYLRLAERTRSLRVDGSIYVAAAERLARTGTLRRVLVTATADYSMLAHLAFGARRGGGAADVPHRRPLRQHARTQPVAGDRMGLAVELTQSDVLAFRKPSLRPRVCTLFSSAGCPVEDRPALFKVWRGSLSDEGRLCFSTRVWQDRYRYDADGDERARRAGCERYDQGAC